MTTSRIFLLFIFTWAIALLVAFNLDQPVARWVTEQIPVDKHRPATHRLLTLVKLPGDFRFTLCVATALWASHPRRGGAAISLCLSGILTGALYSLIKWISGRHRPVWDGKDPWHFHPFLQGVPGIWREQALCFPSGHASLSFATATCLSMLLPRWKWAFFFLALLTSAERVLENAHYLSDVVAGAGLGIAVGWGVTRMVLGKLSPEVVTPNDLAKE